MITLSTHVLDTSTGEPGQGMEVVLERRQGDEWETAGRGTTDSDGRVGDLGSDLVPGTFRLRFATDKYGNEFFPEVQITIRLDGDRDHYHVPLLLSSFGYTTYRGS